MPTYEYACTACGQRLEAVQKFSDDPLTECAECGGALRKVYGAVGIVLKGSGFYKTDSRAAASAGSGNGNGNGNGNGTSKEKEKAKDSSSSSSSDSSSKESKDSSSKSDSGGSGSKDSKPATAAAS